MALNSKDKGGWRRENLARTIFECRESAEDLGLIKLKRLLDKAHALVWVEKESKNNDT